MAIIIQHHLKPDGSLYGRQDKIFQAAVVINITRTAKENSTLTTPFQVIIKNSRFTHFHEDLAPFNVCYDENTKRFVVNDDNGSYEKYVKAIGNHYKKTGRTQDDLAEHLGVSTNTLTNHLKA